jgi:hypothetical protein
MSPFAHVLSAEVLFRRRTSFSLDATIEASAATSVNFAFSFLRAEFVHAT